jgi:ankyrin repeat protein
MKKRLIILLAAAGFIAVPVSASEIHDACKAGNLERVKALLSGDPALLQAKTEEGKTPLHMSVGWGRLATVKYLLSVGADINAVNNNGGTPLHVAASQNQPECARLLVAKGAPLNARQGRTGATPLAIAVMKGNYEAAKVLIELGADLNIPMKNGATPLQVASRQGDSKMTALLKSKGVR